MGARDERLENFLENFRGVQLSSHKGTKKNKSLEFSCLSFDKKI